VQQQDDAFRRTWLRYPDGAIASAGRILANDAAHMTDPAQRTRPNPSYANCGACPFLNPCQAERAGRDSAPILQAAYRERQPETLAAARLGTGGWGLGRGTPPTGLKRTRT
jgi:hypothetical protein